jgi:hypothetical protein
MGPLGFEPELAAATATGGVTLPPWDTVELAGPATDLATSVRLVGVHIGEAVLGCTGRDGWGWGKTSTGGSVEGGNRADAAGTAEAGDIDAEGAPPREPAMGIMQIQPFRCAASAAVELTVTAGLRKGDKGWSPYVIPITGGATTV